MPGETPFSLHKELLYSHSSVFCGRKLSESLKIFPQGRGRAPAPCWPTLWQAVREPCKTPASRCLSNGQIVQATGATASAPNPWTDAGQPRAVQGTGGAFPWSLTCSGCPWGTVPTFSSASSCCLTGTIPSSLTCHGEL